MATALVVVVAGIVTIVAVGPGKDKLDRGSHEPVRSSSRVGAGPSSSRVERDAPVGATVRMHALRFAPHTVHVRVGQAVRWVNRDDVAHDVYEDVGARSGVTPLLNSPRIGRGGSYRFVFRTPGTIRYVCTLHAGVMSGRIVVSGGEA